MGKLIKLPVSRRRPAPQARPDPAPPALRGMFQSGRKRKQAVRSSAWLIDAAATCLGGSIPLDPCAYPNSKYWFAETNWTRGALDRPWELPSYANIPYKWLVLWLQYAQREAFRTQLPTLVLGPWRSHRLGFNKAIEGSTVVFFKAFPFEGHKNSPPFPIALYAWNTDRFPRTPYEVDRRAW